MLVKMVKGIVFLSFIIISSLRVAAQGITGEVNYESLGIKMTIPDGWIGQETNNGLILGHHEIPGLVIITTNSYKSLASIENDAMSGIQDENGTNLAPSSGLVNWHERGLYADYSGTLQWEPVKLFALALINDHGYGVTLMAGTTPSLYSDVYKELVLQIAKGIEFYQPKAAPVVKEWKDWLANKRLTYMDSYYSSGTGTDGYSTGGGYSTTIRMDLCSQGYFRYSGNSDVSVSSGGGFGYADDTNSGSGTWDVLGNASGGANLILNFNNGEVYEYELTYEDQKTYLNGKRYFVTDGSNGPDEAPECF